MAGLNDQVGADQLTLPGGALHTLRDAGKYIAKLPKREHDTFAWRAATGALLLIAEHGGMVHLTGKPPQRSDDLLFKN